MDEVGITVKDFSQGNSALCMQKLTCTSYAGACSRNVFFAAKGFLEKEFFFALWIWEWILSCIFTVPLAWPHTCDIRKLVIFIAGRGSSRRDGPDSLSRAQGKPVLGLLIKPAETKNILKNRPFFFFVPYKMSVEFFFFKHLCFVWIQAGLWITQLQWFFASGLGLSSWAIPLMPALAPALPLRCFSHAHTHPHTPMELFSAPTAQTFGSSHYPFGRSVAQAGEEAGDSRCSW